MIMRSVTRRAFIGTSASAALANLCLPVLASAAKVRFKIGATDWNLKQEGKIQSISLAKQLGFDGIQICIGRGSDKLPLSDPGLQKAFLDESKRVDLKIESLCLDILHRNFLKSDPLGQRWVADSIPIAKAMGVRVVLLTYYDVGNSTNNGFDVVKEIRWLGAARICEVHLKDNPHYLGEGTIDFKGVINALADVGFEGWAQLETDSPASVEADMRRTLEFIRG